MSNPDEPAELEDPVAEDPEAHGWPDRELTDEEREYLAHLADPDDLQARGVYDRMIHRNVEGPDPLVQEPKE